jgi:hypothetical protein
VKDIGARWSCYLVATPRWVSGMPSSAAIPEAEVIPAEHEFK